eukprot:31151-Pelagococcus_subviridis.AAC.4
MPPWPRISPPPLANPPLNPDAPATDHRPVRAPFAAAARASARPSLFARSGATSVAIDRKRARFALSSRVSLIASSFERAIKDSTIGRLTPGVSASGGARRPSAANAGADDASPDHAVVAAFRVTASAALTASSTRISWR